jgi:hypothetical protein
LIAATGNVTGGNLTTGGVVSATGNLIAAGIALGTGNIVGGNITATHFGSGAGLTSLTGANVTGTVPLATSATTAGTVTTAAQSNITSVGTLSSVTVTANVTAGNLVLSGSISDSSQLDLITGAGNIVLTPAAGSNVQIAANANITAATISTSTATGALRVAGGAGVVGNVYAGAFYGAATGLTAIPGANVTGTVANATFATSAGSATTATSATSATTAGTVTTAAQGNITSVGTLTSLTVSGALSSGAHTITGSPLTAVINGGTNGVGNIGASGATFNTVFAKATTAQYADLAENYSADAAYEPGTVLDFGGKNEVTLSTVAGSNRIAGVVSTNPAYLMNSMLATEHVAAVALAGRVPTRVTGPVRKGDMMVSAGNGQACASATPVLGSVIGKALENFDDSQGIIEIVVGRM